MPALQVGMILKNRYRISKVLYQSMLANVYSVDDIHLPGNIWAVKEMKFLALDSIDRQVTISQFEQEIMKMAELSHPNIARLIDFFVEGQNLYIIREYIPAYDIGTLMSKTSEPLRERDVLSWGAQIADALNYLYNKKFPAVFFKELMPANILITSDGTVKIIDLGLARIFQTETNPERLKVMGTMDYASPEQFDEAGIFDQRTLVYNLGAMLYHILTRHNPGQTPFKLQPIEKLNPDISKATAKIIKKAIQISPISRYQSLIEIKKDLSALVKTPGSSADRLLAGEKEDSRLNIWIYILAAIAFILTGGMVLLVMRLL